MNTYLNDQFVGRSCWVGGQSLLEYRPGKREISGVYIGRNALYRHYPSENVNVCGVNIEGISTFAQRYGNPATLMLIPSSTCICQSELSALATAWDEERYIEIRLVDLRSFAAGGYGTFVEAECYDEALFLYSTDTFSQQLGPGRLAG